MQRTSRRHTACAVPRPTHTEYTRHIATCSGYRCARDNPDLVFGNLSLPYTTVFLGSETGVEVIRQRLLDGQPTFFYLWYVCLFRPEIRTLNSRNPYP
jgi:hypothetical protein